MSSTLPDFSAILHGIPQPYLVLDRDLVIVTATDSYLALTERTRDDIVGRHILEAYPENPDAAGTVEQGPLEVSLRHVLATGKPHEMAVIQYDIPQPGGGFSQKFWTPVHTPVAGESGAIEYIIQNPMDVTETVLKSREADARLRVALHAADLASWEYEPETDIWRRSHAVDEMFGFAAGEVGSVAKPFFARMHPEDLERVTTVVESILSCPDQTVMNFDYRVMLPSGKTRYVASRGEVLRTSTGKVRILGVMMDVTEDRAREAQLSSALKAQEQLLTEVNHRVKNSLQLVVSTLRLQARRLTDQVTIEAFQQAISRVRAIISVHERLYRTQNSLSVDMIDHLQNLCLDMVGVTNPRGVVVNSEAISLSTERAIPVSVILNELVTPLLKQGHDDSGPVAVSLRRIPGSFIELMVQDENKAEPSSELSVELSQKLIASMAAQISGNFSEANDERGYRALITFPEERV
jgi:PAS domain S-box-containing protein